MKKIQFPDINKKMGLGFGFDLPWGMNMGFQYGQTPENDHVTPHLARFLQRYANDINYLFVAFQPRNRNKLVPQDYFPAYDDLFLKNGSFISNRALHHTILNTGTLEEYDHKAVSDFTNVLIARYDFKWVVEDLGIWTISGKSLPYPLPPILTDFGLNAAIFNVNQYKKSLLVPFCIEFPGFTEGNTIFLGDMNAFEFFKCVAEETASPVTLDVGHLLSYLWLMGKDQNNMEKELEKLPLEYCFELHLSGCSIHSGKFRDMHHGVLLDEQIQLLDYLLENCSNLRAVTYEDPKFTPEGELIPKSIRNFLRLKEKVEIWRQKEIAVC